mgnify:CR=1 FL=1
MVPAFALRDISLGYLGFEVLRVDELVVPQGGMAFVIGPSGAGKSTLLETLGLMSDTFIKGGGGTPEFRIEGEAFAPATLWSAQRRRLADIRRERFSFIFQSTNLMPNFTIWENIRMASFSGDEPEEDVRARVGSLMDALNLPRHTLDKPAHAVSGGQRQRIAFIRAMVKDYSVLLADEPTGNLDPENAVILFEVLKKSVTDSGRTAVVVTHHVELAERFGDLVIELEPGARKELGGQDGAASPARLRTRTGAWDR